VQVYGHGPVKGLHGRIDEMIEADPAIATATIWQRLADDRGTTVTYPTLRTYVTSKRASTKAPGKTSEQPDEVTPHGRFHHPHPPAAVGTSARDPLRSCLG
jgi:hypothetical protein